MALFGDGITFEPLTGDDLDDIVGLAADTWYFAGGENALSNGGAAGSWLDDSERERIACLMATDEIATYFADMTWGVKAVLKGKTVGVVVTHGMHVSAEAAERYGRIGAEARQHAEELLTAARERSEHAGSEEPDKPAYQEELQVTEEMCEKIGLTGQPRILLLVVSSEARGKGLGKRLLDQARDHFRRHNAKSFWLVTDTDCDWPFYEHLGLERLAERKSTVAGAPESYYIYGGEA
jgi:ribosomal protein S18 acetylase RimI-like enzyme